MLLGWPEFPETWVLSSVSVPGIKQSVGLIAEIPWCVLISKGTLANSHCFHSSVWHRFGCQQEVAPKKRSLMPLNKLPLTFHSSGEGEGGEMQLYQCSSALFWPDVKLPKQHQVIRGLRQGGSPAGVISTENNLQTQNLLPCVPSVGLSRIIS